MNIRLLSHKDIDPVKWDDSISRFYNGCVYAYSWYLDRTCNTWMALVDDDYETLLPLPVTEFKGENLILQPGLVRYLGLFTNKLLTKELLITHLRFLNENFPFVSITLSKYNRLSSAPEPYVLSKTQFHCLDLMPNYTKISSRYSRKALENIQSAHNQKIIILGGLQPRELMAFIAQKTSRPSEKLDEKSQRRFRSLISHALFHNFGEIYGAYDIYNNLCAAVFFLGSHQKVYVPFFVQSAELLSEPALYLIFDHFIKKNSEKNVVLNFEIPTLPKNKTNLFADFGAKETALITLNKNKLTFWKRWMK